MQSPPSLYTLEIAWWRPTSASAQGQKGLQEHSLWTTVPAVPFLASWFSVPINLLSLSWCPENLSSSPQGNWGEVCAARAQGKPIQTHGLSSSFSFARLAGDLSISSNSTLALSKGKFKYSYT